jgi:hypothetical protein
METRIGRAPVGDPLQAGAVALGARGPAGT